MRSSRTLVHLSALVCAPLSALGVGVVLSGLSGMSEPTSFFLGAHIVIPLWVIFSVLFVLVGRARWILITCGVCVAVAVLVKL